MLQIPVKISKEGNYDYEWMDFCWICFCMSNIIVINPDNGVAYE